MCQSRSIVQINEGLLRRRKYNCGHFVHGQWMFGMIDVDTGFVHILLVN